MLESKEPTGISRKDDVMDSEVIAEEFQRLGAFEMFQCTKLEGTCWV